MMKNNSENVTGVVLAGGKARRMGGADKGLIEINQQPMIQYVLNILKPQVKELVINANRNVNRYEEFGYPVITDQLEDFQGPLAGIAACMEIADTQYICTCPCDGPLIANDLVDRLFTSLTSNNKQYDIAVAHDGKRMQPVYALINCELHANLLNYLASGERKIDRWYALHNCVEADFNDRQDCFVNVNTPEEQQQLSQHLAKQQPNA